MAVINGPGGTTMRAGCRTRVGEVGRVPTYFVAAMEEALQHGRPEIFNSNQGSQYFNRKAGVPVSSGRLG